MRICILEAAESIQKNFIDAHVRQAKIITDYLKSQGHVVYLLDGGKKILDDEIKQIENLAKKETLIVAITKIDVLKYEKVYPLLLRLSQIKEIKEIVPLSSLARKNLDVLENSILKLLPETEEKNFYYETDEYTDKSVRFLVAEMVREKALFLYDAEIPHGLAIEVIEFDEQEDIAFINIDIVCEREQHKAILIGKKGYKLKELGEQSRKDMQELLGKKVMLKLFVKTKKNWRDSQNQLTNLGYNDNF